LKESSLLSRLRLSFRRSTFKANALQAMASGAAFAWCFAASPPPLLAFVALAPFLLLLSQPKTLRLGWLFGAAYWLAAMPWIVATIETFGGVPPGLSHFLLLLMALYLGFESAIFAWLGAKIWRHGGGQGSLLRYAGLPALWVLLEAQRGFFFNGFPWNLAAYAWTDLPGALPLSAWVGALGVSFLLVFANVAVASAWETRRLAVPAACLLAVLLVLCLAGRFSRADAPTRGGIEVRLVQPNSAITRDSEQIERQYQRLLDLSAAECNPSREVLLVWPESAAWPYLYERSLRLRDDLARLSARGCHVLLSSASSEAAVGQEVGQEQGWRNVALLVGKLGVEAEYAKRRLVPWGEYVPLKSVLPFVGYLARNAGEFVPGKELGLMDIGGEKLAPAICYEVIFPSAVALQVEAGATILVTLTNDAWYGDTAAPWQHLRAARFRAAENRRPLLRAALTGVSALVDAQGQVVEQLGVGEEGVLRGRARGQQEKSPFTRAPWLMVAFSALLATFAIIRSRRP